MRDLAQLDALVGEHYGTREVRARYVRRREQGLCPWEAAVLATHHTASARDFLVLGGGAGRESKGLATRGFFVTSVDRSAELTAEGRVRAGERERFWCLQLPEDGLPNDRFDHVALWSQLLANVSSAERRGDLLALATRSLKPAGRLSFSVHELTSTLALVTDAVRVESSDQPGDFVMTEPGEAPCYWHYFTRAEVVGSVARAGLTLDALVSAADFGDPARANLLIGLCHRP